MERISAHLWRVHYWLSSEVTRDVAGERLQSRARAQGVLVGIVEALIEGQTHEMKLAPELLDNLHDAYGAGARAYAAQALVPQLQQQDCQVVIPSNPTRKTQHAIDRSFLAHGTYRPSSKNEPEPVLPTRRMTREPSEQHLRARVVSR